MSYISLYESPDEDWRGNQVKYWNGNNKDENFTQRDIQKTILKNIFSSFQSQYCGVIMVASI